jgi:hypothetical protein
VQIFATIVLIFAVGSVIFWALEKALWVGEKICRPKE